MQNLLRTDARFNVRLLAHESPSQNSKTFNGLTCTMMSVAYTKLRAKIGLRKQGATAPIKTYWMEAPVNGCSGVAEFNVAGMSSSPYILEVLDVEWDYSCIHEQKMSVTTPNNACPWDSVWQHDCYDIALQWSTDNTKDIPH